MKKEVHLQNYRDWFVAYCDGALTETEILSLYEFMYQHPLVLKEWEEWLDACTLKLVAPDNIIFPNKDKLFLTQNYPETEPVLIPDTSLTYPHKSKLLKKNRIHSHFNTAKRIALLAACFLLLLLCFEPTNLNLFKPETNSLSNYTPISQTIESEETLHIITSETQTITILQPVQKKHIQSEPTESKNPQPTLACLEQPAFILNLRPFSPLSSAEEEEKPTIYLSENPALLFTNNTTPPNSFYIPLKTRQLISNQINKWIKEKTGISPFENDINIQVKLGQITLKPHKPIHSNI